MAQAVNLGHLQTVQQIQLQDYSIDLHTGAIKMREISPYEEQTSQEVESVGKHYSLMLPKVKSCSESHSTPH